ncbi:muramoyltetrapeptide carboxypeptidase [Alistipes timonensis JC136]|uniref:Muramoyltetrapeptide carboxypeptidase n=1 Tax=Alistipes timonensis JC136 TaxID=1033731 RepID=A0A1H4AMU8_9BACT|nr:LD-carboxypeptidase [Alistipes timonensis]SEA37220.1 muramoyltetrapeptide carboxypeptidase [Alistipes timonensis JC136]
MKHLFPILLLLAPLFAGAQESDSTGFLRPPYLHRGDTVGIVSPAGKLPLKTDTAKIRQRFESWGLHVKFGPHCADREQPYFAGTDEERAADLQAMIDDESVKAVIACRGGYGSVRLLPLVDLARLHERPKWVVGFSDITMLHLALRKLRIESIHGPMPAGFDFDGKEDPSAESLRQALFGETVCIEVEPHPLNQPGTASGHLSGGNLTVIRSADGTPEELTAEEPTVLLIEEVGEFVYRIDRLMQSLTRSGRLGSLKAILVGHFSDMVGMKKFGVADAYAIISSYTRPLGIPVVFGFPAGHAEPNLAVYLGRRVTVSVDDEGARVEFVPQN